MMTIYRTVDNVMKKVDSMMKGDWINLVNPTVEELAFVSEQTGLAEEFLHYPLDDDELARIETEDGQILIIINVPIITNSAVIYDTLPLGVVLNDEYVVTVSLEDLSLPRHFSSTKVKDAATFKKTRLILQVLQLETNMYLKYLRDINRHYETLENKLRQSMNNNDLNRLLNLQKSLVYFTTSLRANDKVMEKLFRTRTIKMYEEDRDLLDDVIIENKQAIEMADIYTMILRNSMDALASISSNNLNSIMNFLTIITIMVAIPTFITGFFGMNVMIPASESYALTIGILFTCIATATIIYLLLKKINTFK